MQQVILGEIGGLHKPDILERLIIKWLQKNNIKCSSPSWITERQVKTRLKEDNSYNIKVLQEFFLCIMSVTKDTKRSRKDTLNISYLQSYKNAQCNPLFAPLSFLVHPFTLKNSPNKKHRIYFLFSVYFCTFVPSYQSRAKKRKELRTVTNSLPVT